MFKMRAKMITVGLLGTAALIPINVAKADQVGRASWYALPQSKTANGERMNPNDLTAAHRSLPFGTRVLVENLSNGRSVVVRINDRGPFTGGRIIDLSRAAAATLGMIDSGVAKVRVSTDNGGALADLGESGANAKKDQPQADAAEPKPADEAADIAPAPAKAKSSKAKSSKAKSSKAKSGNAKSAKAKSTGAKSAKTKSRTHTAVAAVPKNAIAARSRKSAAAKVAVTSRRSKASGHAAAPGHLAASTNRIRAAAQQPAPSGRVTVASNPRQARAADAKTARHKKTARIRQNRSAG
jgi:peptidoglycan lytic transglycosylase